MASQSKSQNPTNIIDTSYEAPIPSEEELLTLIGDLEPAPVGELQIAKKKEEAEEKAQELAPITPDDDFKFVHKNLKKLIRNGSSAMEDMMKLARASDHPRAYEVLNQMLKTIAELNGELLDVHKKKKELNKDDSGSSEHPPQQVQNNVFVGTTEEFLAMIRNGANSPKVINHEETK